MFKSNFRSGAFHNKAQDQADFLQFSVKQPFQNETWLMPTNWEPGELSVACAGPWFALLDRRHSAGHHTTEVELVKGRAHVLSAVDLGGPGGAHSPKPLPWREATRKKEAPCLALVVPARLAVLSERDEGNPRRSDSVAGVCSDMEES